MTTVFSTRSLQHSKVRLNYALRDFKLSGVALEGEAEKALC